MAVGLEKPDRCSWLACSPMLLYFAVGREWKMAKPAQITTSTCMQWDDKIIGEYRKRVSKVGRS